MKDILCLGCKNTGRILGKIILTKAGQDLEGLITTLKCFDFILRTRENNMKLNRSARTELSEEDLTVRCYNQEHSNKKEGIKFEADELVQAEKGTRC